MRFLLAILLCVAPQISLLSQLEMEVQTLLSGPEPATTLQEGSGGSGGSSSLPRPKLQLYLSACKLLDTALALPPEHLPHFQW